MCQSGFITVDENTPNRSGLYFTDLSGCSVRLLEDITKEDQDDYEACFNYLNKTAWRNLKIDVQLKLAERFHIDKKLVSRETSEFKDTVVESSSELAGIKISVTLPKYAKIQILSIGVFSEQAYQSPEAEFYIYKDDADGELLSTITSELVEGRNTIEVYEDFEEEDIFIGYSPETLELRQTQNKYYPDSRYVDADLSCSFPCWYGGEGSVYQINTGGLNVKFLVYCSMDKLICDNLPLFQYALLYRIGVDTMKERITTQVVNRTTVLTAERATELMGIHNEDYQQALNAAIKNIKMTEDPICFLCKRTISARTNLP